jgi:hypothetical protein
MPLNKSGRVPIAPAPAGLARRAIPTVEGRLSPSGSQIIVTCPYCGEQHFHGAAGDYGHRAPHCDLQRYPHASPGYIITAPIAETRLGGQTGCRPAMHTRRQLRRTVSEWPPCRR